MSVTQNMAFQAIVLFSISKSRKKLFIKVILSLKAATAKSLKVSSEGAFLGHQIFNPHPDRA